MTFGVTPPEVIFTVAPEGVGLGIVESLPPQANAATASTAAAVPSAHTFPGPAEAGRHDRPAEPPGPDPAAEAGRHDPAAEPPRRDPGAESRRGHDPEADPGRCAFFIRRTCARC